MGGHRAAAYHAQDHTLLEAYPDAHSSVASPALAQTPAADPEAQAALAVLVGACFAPVGTKAWAAAIPRTAAMAPPARR